MVGQFIGIALAIGQRVMLGQQRADGLHAFDGTGLELP